MSKPNALERYFPFYLSILTCLIIFASAWGCIALTRFTDSTATVWLANAALLTILFKKPRRLWPALLCAGYAGNVLADLMTGEPPSLSLILSACNSIEILFVAIPLRRWARGEPDLTRLSHLGVFVGLAGFVAPALAGLIAGTLLHYLSSSSVAVVWAAWYPADALGYLVLTPLLLMLGFDDIRAFLRKEGRRGRALWFAVLMAITAGVFSQSSYPLLYIPMAMLGFNVVQLGPAGTALGIGFIAVIATAATVNGLGPMMLVPGDLSIRIFVLQSFIAAIVLAKLPLIAILSDRKRLAVRVSEANRQLCLAETIAQLGHWHLDVALQRLTWSDGVFHIHGLDPATYRPSIETAIAAYHPDDRADVARFVDLALTQAQECDFALRLIRTDGSVRDIVARVRCEVAADNKVGAIFGTIIDVTELRQAERTVVRSEARYRLLADHTSDVILLSHANGYHSYVSPAVKTVLGYPIDEAYSIGMRDLIHADDLEDALAITMGLSPSRPMASLTFRIKHKAGHYIWAEAACQLVEDEADDMTVVMTIRDVTERVQQAKRLEKAKIEAEAGARIKAEFLANMSHELRTPLSGILGVHDLLQNDASLSKPQRHLIDLARDSGRWLLTIVNDILDFSKIEAGQVAIEQVRFALREQVESCCRLGRQSIKSNDVALEVDIDPNVPDFVFGDPTRVRQILLNLIMNAVKFTSKGSVSVRVKWSDGLLRMEVSDTGIGIATHALPHLFERFSQADGSTARQFGGTGLGLAISKRLVELMDGKIGVDSVLGTGSTFWLILPLIVAQTDASPDLPIIPSADWTFNGRTVLVAEDNVVNQEIIRIALSEKGLHTTIVGDGVSAVDAFCKSPFDIILMDVQMPQMDGLAATAAIRALEKAEQRQATPIVALTANMMVEETERCQQAGMDAHVGKPIDWAQLFQTIERLCNSRAQPDSTLSMVQPDIPPAFVLDEAVLGDLAALLGREKIASLLTLFRSDTNRRVALLETSGITGQDLFSHAHALVSSAGQLGFKELSELCVELERLSRAGGGLDRISAFRAVADRAMEAAASSPYLQTA